MQAKAQLAKLVQDERSMQQSSSEILRLLTQTSEPATLDTVMAGLLVDISRMRLENGITVSAVNPGVNIATTGASPVGALAKKLEASDVQSARVNVRGTYDSYEGLLTYVEQVRKHSVAVVFLKIEGQTFELGLRAYGV